MYDNKILENMLFIKNLKILDRKYFLANNRYYNINYILCLYCNIYQYPIKQIEVRKKSVKKKKLFNLCYFIHYNIVEIIFKIMK